MVLNMDVIQLFTSALLVPFATAIWSMHGKLSHMQGQLIAIEKYLATVERRNREEY